MDISLYRMIPPAVRDSVFVNTVPLMRIISHEIEDVVIENQLSVDFYAGFQRFSRFLPQVTRYTRLAHVCRRVYVWGEADVTPPPIPGVEYLPLRPEMALTREWFLVIDSPEFFTALLTQEITEVATDDAPTADRHYRGIWTYDSDLVSRAHLLVTQMVGGFYNPSPQRDYETQSHYLVQISNRLVQRQDKQTGKHVLAQHQNSLLKAGLTYLETPLLMLDTQQHIVAVTAAVERLLSIPRDDLIGQPLHTCADGLFSSVELIDDEVTHTYLTLASNQTIHATATRIIDDHDQAVGWMLALQTAADTAPSTQITRPSPTVVPIAPLLLRYLGGMQQLLTMLPSLAGRQEVQQRVLSQMQRLVNDSTALVRRLALLQEIEALTEPPQAPIDIAAIVQHALADWQQTTDAATLQVHLEPVPPLPTMYGNADHLHLALRELLENAAQHAQGTSIVINVSHDDTTVSIAVRDNGSGIDQADLTMLLRSTYHSVEGRSGGNLTRIGLGIALVQAVMRQHHGTLVAESSVGQGSTFILSLPLSKPNTN